MSNTKIKTESERRYVIVASTEGDSPIECTIDEILNSNESENSEMMYCLYEHTDDVLDLRPFQHMAFQPNRDDKNSKGVIIRVK